MKLMPGDVFAVNSDSLLAKSINAVQWIHSRDGEAKYNHAGIILDETGQTLEALWTIRKGHMDAYRGKQVIIARINAVSIQKREAVLKQLIVEHMGQWYPFWRIPLHIVPPLAKISISKRLVCSEFDAKYEARLGVRHGQWAGTNPDTLADEWRKWRGFDILFEGEWT